MTPPEKTTPQGPNRRRKLSDDIRDRLLLLLKERALKPGDIIPSERELMAEFGVGRPVVREAMQALQGRGLIDINHGERPRVAEPSLSNMMGALADSMRHTLLNSATTLDDLKEARILFEAEMARLAARNASGDDLAELRAILEAQTKAQDDAQAFLSYDGDFHTKIAQMSGNPIFATLSPSLFGWLSEFHSGLVRAPNLERLTLEEHHLILEAIEAGKDAEAAQLMTDHLSRANRLYHKANLTS